MRQLIPNVETVQTAPGTTAATLALQKFGDATRFREIMEANPRTLSPADGLSTLQSQLSLDIPNLSSFTRALPILGEISQTTNRVRALSQQGRDYVSQGQQIVSQLNSIVPSGYTQAALDALGKISGTLDQVESVLDQANFDALLNNARTYSGETQLIDWLLS